MSELFEVGKAIVRDEAATAKTALRRIRKGESQMLSDKQLIHGAREALWADDVPAALAALNEYALRKEMDGPVAA